jgi:tetratricopeptide (TPR) repeat protein
MSEPEKLIPAAEPASSPVIQGENESRPATQSDSSQKGKTPSWLVTLTNSRWIGMILGIAIIGLFGTVVLQTLFSQVVWFRAGITLTFVAYFPLTYLAYQLRSEKHRQRLTQDFRLLGMARDEKEENELKEQFQKVYSPQQFIVFISMASLVTLLGFGLQYFKPTFLFEMMGEPATDIAEIMFYSFLGALVFSVYNVYRRFVTFDLQPGVYLYVAVMMVTVMVFGLVASRFLIETVISPAILPIVGFLIGYFPDTGLRWLVSVGGRVLGRFSRKETSLAHVDGISIWHETRLHESAIDNVQNLASCDMRDLLLSSRFSAQELINWIDQAILLSTVNKEVNKALSDFGIHTMSTFRSIYEEGFESLPELPLQILGKDEVKQRRWRPAKPSREQAETAEENGKKGQAEVPVEKTWQDNIYRNNLRAMYRGIYHAADTSPNYALVENYWIAVKQYNLRQVETGLRRSIQNQVTSSFNNPDEVERIGRAWKALGLDLLDLEKLLPDSSEVLVGLGQVYAQDSRYSDAIRVLTRAIRQDANYAPAFSNRGLTHALRGNFEEAFADFNHAEQLDDCYPALYNHKATAFLARNQFEKMVQSLNRAIQLDSDYADAYFKRGRAWFWLNKLDLAQSDFDKAIKLDPRMVEAYIELGKILVQKSLFREAIQTFDQALHYDRAHAGAYFWRGVAYLGFKDFDRAIYDLEVAIDLDPNMSAAYNSRGLVNFQKENYDGAVDDFDQAIRLEPNNAEAYRNRGLSKFLQDEPAQALADLKKYIQFAPNATDADDVRQSIASLEERLRTAEPRTSIPI